MVPEIRERKPDVALALVGSIVHCREQSVLTGPLPGDRQKAIRRPVASPGGDAFEQLPTAFAEKRLAEYGEQPVVELRPIRIDRFVRAPAQVRRDSFLSSLELTVVKEPQARRQECNHCRGLMDPGRKGGCRPRLVVVFQKAGELVLIIQPRMKVFAHRTGVLFAKAVVEPLIVGVVETL